VHQLLPPVLALLLGAILLVAGRRLFWFLVGVAGFLAGMWFALLVFGPEPEWMRWMVATLAGLLGVVLAKFFQRLAIGVAGFFVGGYAAIDLFNLDLAGGGPGAWILFSVAGVLIAIVAGWLFELALIAVSSYLGAVLVLDALPWPETGLMLAVLFAVGVLVQGSLGSPRRRAAQRVARIQPSG
jgi:hypothetical protein